MQSDFNDPLLFLFFFFQVQRVSGIGGGSTPEKDIPGTPGTSDGGGAGNKQPASSTPAQTPPPAPPAPSTAVGAGGDGGAGVIGASNSKPPDATTAALWLSRPPHPTFDDIMYGSFDIVMEHLSRTVTLYTVYHPPPRRAILGARACRRVMAASTLSEGDGSFDIVMAV